MSKGDIDKHIDNLNKHTPPRDANVTPIEAYYARCIKKIEAKAQYSSHHSVSLITTDVVNQILKEEIPNQK